jgi:tRNA threonylcarbamoyladenosine biosynthesis protein TsaB
MDERFLIIDTAHRRGHVAVALGEQVVGTRFLEEARRHARDLAPLVQELLREQNWRPRELTGVIVSRGPGSYTGLRVGLISAKTLAYATGCELIGIDTFAAIAGQAPPGTPRVDVIADAQQGKIYVQSFVNCQGGPLSIQTCAAWLEDLASGTWVTGPGLEACAGSLPQHASLAPPQDWLPRPESLLALAWEHRRRGERDDPFGLEPLYLRASAAEEKWRKKE